MNMRTRFAAGVEQARAEVPVPNDNACAIIVIGCYRTGP